VYYARFDYALLSIFTLDQLATAFTVVQMSEGEWHVFQGKHFRGLVRAHGTGFDAHKVEFIPHLRGEAE